MSVCPLLAATNKGVNPSGLLTVTLPPCAKAVITPSMSPDADEFQSLASHVLTLSIVVPQSLITVDNLLIKNNPEGCVLSVRLHLVHIDAVGQQEATKWLVKLLVSGA